MDGVIDKEADQYIGGNASTGGDSGMGETVGDGMVNQGSYGNSSSRITSCNICVGCLLSIMKTVASKLTFPPILEVNKVAREFGAPGMADGVIDKEVDQEVNKFL